MVLIPDHIFGISTIDSIQKESSNVQFDGLYSFSPYFICKDTTMASIWTSGSSEGASCDIDRNFIWCSTGTLIKEADVNNADNWIYSIPDGNASDEKCLVLNYDAPNNKTALQRSKCQGNMTFLCKVKYFIALFPCQIFALNCHNYFSHYAMELALCHVYMK